MCVRGVRSVRVSGRVKFFLGCVCAFCYPAVTPTYREAGGVNAMLNLAIQKAINLSEIAG